MLAPVLALVCRSAVVGNGFAAADLQCWLRDRELGERAVVANEYRRGDRRWLCMTILGVGYERLKGLQCLNAGGAALVGVEVQEVTRPRHLEDRVPEPERLDSGEFVEDRPHKLGIALLVSRLDGVGDHCVRHLRLLADMCLMWMAGIWPDGR